MHYGSLINKDKNDDLDQADKKLYKWTADGFTSFSEQDLKKLQERYPFDGGTLYRGLHFNTKEQYDKFMKSFNGSYESGSHSSWTTSKETAADFARTEKTYFPTSDIMQAYQDMQNRGDHMPGYGGVILKTESQIGIDVNKSDFAKEPEVILPPGTYTASIDSEMIPFKRSIKEEHIEDILKRAKRGESLNAEINFVTRSFGHKLTKEQNDIIVEYYYDSFFKIAASEPEKLIHITVTENPLGMYKGEMDIHISVDFPFIDTAISDKMETKLTKIANKLSRLMKPKIEEVIHKIGSKPIREVYVNPDVKQLKKFSSIVDVSVQPLKQFLANRYHEMNAREFTKNVTDLHKHSKQVETILKGIIALS